MGKPWIICTALHAGRPRVIRFPGLWFLFLYIWCDSSFEGSTNLKVYTYTEQQTYSKNANLLACVFQLTIEVTFLVIFFDQETTVHVATTVTGERRTLAFFHTRYVCREYLLKKKIIYCNWVLSRWQWCVTCIQNMKLVTTKFKSGGLYEKHVVATWNLGNHLRICF